MTGSLAVLRLHLLVFGGQCNVELVERVNLYDVTAHDGTHGLQLLFQAGNLCHIGRLYLTQLFQQALGTCLLFVELLLQRVVGNLHLQFVILGSKGGVFVLHLFFLNCEKLCHLFVFGCLLHQQDGNDHQSYCQCSNPGYTQYLFLVHICLDFI